MSHQQPAPTALGLSVEKEPSLPFITDSHSIALDQLGRAFTEARPLAILIGEGKSDASFLIRHFLAGIEGDVTVVRITEPCADAMAGMREIIHAIGFEAKDLSLADLENIFTMFLSSQRTHHRRTIICIEETQDNGQWVLDGVRRLIELEMEGKFGLMVILSGRPGLNELLNEPPLDAICAQAGKRITLAPFSQAETREFIRWQVESAGTADIGQVFEFHAITLIHEFCAGVPDAITTLCCKCRELADQEDTAPVTTDLVKKAGKLLRLTPLMELSDAETVSVEISKVGPRRGRLIARTNGDVIQEQPLNRERILIGRDELCDIRIASHLVSRHHALVVNSSQGVKLVDLGSTNGTFVDGRKIKQCALQDSQVITIGDCTIEYVAGDDQQAWFGDMDPTEKFEQDNTGPASPGKGLGSEMQLLELEPAKTKISSGRRRARR